MHIFKYSCQSINYILLLFFCFLFKYGFCTRFEYSFYAEVAQLVEHNLAKVRVAGSSPVFRSCFQNGLVILRNCGAFYL